MKEQKLKQYLKYIFRNILIATGGFIFLIMEKPFYGTGPFPGLEK
jgi:hypothetical protein